MKPSEIISMKANEQAKLNRGTTLARLQATSNDSAA